MSRLSFLPFLRVIVTQIAFYPFLLLSQTPELIIPTGHTGGINSVCISPDGKYALSGSNDRTLKLWDLSTGKEIRDFKGHTESVQSVCFSPDGKYILSGSFDKTIKLWDISSGKEVRSFKGHNDWVTSVCFSPDGNYALSASDDYTLKLWNLSTGKEIRSFKDHLFAVNAVAFSPDGKYAVSGSDDTTLKLWEIATGKVIRNFAGHSLSVNSVCFSPDGKYALSGSCDNTIKLWDISSGKELKSFSGHSDCVNSVCFSKDGRYILSGSFDNTMKLWDVSSGKEIRSFKGHPYIGVHSVCFTPDGKFALSGSDDYTMKLWDISTGKEIRSFSGHSDLINALAYSPNGKYILAGSQDHTLKLLDIQTGKVIRCFEGHSNSVTSICFSQDGKYALSGSADSTMRLWDILSGKEIRSFTGNSDIIYSVTLSPDGKFALSGTGGGQIMLWDIATGEQIRSFTGHLDAVITVCFLPEGKSALSASWDRSIRLWDINNGKEIRRFDELKYGVESVCISPDGKFALSGSIDGNLKLWDISTGKEIKNILINSPVLSVCFSPDRKSAFSGLRDGSIHLWDIATGGEITSFTGHLGQVNSLCISPDEKYLLSASSDHSLKLWDIASGKEIVTVILLDRNDWLVKTPDNYYYASRNAVNLVGYRIGNRRFDFEQFDLQYNRPDIVLERIGYAPKELIESFRQAYLKRLRKMHFNESMFSPEFHTPDIEIINKDSLPMTTNNSQLELSVMAVDNIYKLERINVWVNDVPVFGMNGISLKDMASDLIQKRILVKLSQGVNKIQVSCLNERGTESLKEAVEITYLPNLPVHEDVYFIGIGVSRYQNEYLILRYATKDIRDLANIIKVHYPDVIIDTLTDNKATKENIRDIKDRLMKTTVDDIVIISISGHGMLSDSLDFYYGTWDIDPRNPRGRGLAFDDLDWLLDSIPARKKLVFMDACHSGEMDEDEELSFESSSLGSNVKVEGSKGAYRLIDSTSIGLKNSFDLMQELFANLSRGNGAVVISAAGGKQYAYEGENWKNGVFTYSIIKGLKGQEADVNHDGEITVGELKDYVFSEVEQLTKGRQMPTARRENLESDWNVW